MRSAEQRVVHQQGKAEGALLLQNAVPQPRARSPTRRCLRRRGSRLLRAPFASLPCPDSRRALLPCPEHHACPEPQLGLGSTEYRRARCCRPAAPGKEKSTTAQSPSPGTTLPSHPS
eukprot:4153907-Pleurochrysis_carterae.AAC.2